MSQEFEVAEAATERCGEVTVSAAAARRASERRSQMDEMTLLLLPFEEDGRGGGGGAGGAMQESTLEWRGQLRGRDFLQTAGTLPPQIRGFFFFLS